MAKTACPVFLMIDVDVEVEEREPGVGPPVLGAQAGPNKSPQEPQSLQGPTVLELRSPGGHKTLVARRPSG